MAEIDFSKGTDFSEYTDEELIDFRNKIEMNVGMLEEELSDKVVSKMGTDFDPYSTISSMKLKKITKPYAKLIDGASYLHEQVSREIEKREDYREEQRYIGRSVKKQPEISEEEFLEKEEEKTWIHRSKIE